MVAGEAVVFFLLLSTALAIRADVAETKESMYRISMQSMICMVSDNVMLDCCHWLYVHASDSQDPIVDIGSLEADFWARIVSGYLDSQGFKSTITIEGLKIEPLGNQTTDLAQEGFLGRSGKERWFVSATLTVWLALGESSTAVDYLIRIAA